MYYQIMRLLSEAAVAKIGCFMQVATAVSLCLWNGIVKYEIFPKSSAFSF